MSSGWDAQGYARDFAFVPAYGRELIGILDPKKGEKILDLGCGTGSLTSEIASSGADVTGVDRDSNMIALAKQAHPKIPFFEQDAENFTLTTTFDAVFSNAALHWMKIENVFPQVAKVLRQGGRFAAELGGVHNITAIERAIYKSLERLGINNKMPTPWTFPTPAAIAAALERSGFEVRYMHLYDRLTPLGTETGGIKGWIKMFGRAYFEHIPADKHETFLQYIEEEARPALWRDNQWHADYRRQHFVGIKL